MAPTTLRSASISSASTSSSKITSDGIKKKFSCSHPSCGKSFSRSEHLHRHALNHKDGNNTCLRCSAHFRRRDLLDRHMSRHKEKDDEAGGEGLGVLATRKRLWRDTDGKIVNARRPSYTQETGNKRRMISKPSAERKDSKSLEQARKMSSVQQILTPLPPSPASMSRDDSVRSTIVVDTSRPQLYSKSEPQSHPEEEDVHRRPWYQSHGTALPSPSTSASSYSDHDSSLQSESQSPSAELDTLYEDAWPIHAPALPELIHHSPILGRDSGYPANPGWGPQPSFQTFMGASGEFEDAPPIKDAFGSGMGLYGWQNPWSVGSQMMLSRCREEKYENASERGLDYPHQEVLRRGFGLGSC